MNPADIVVTLGPASQKEGVLKEMLDAGATVIRLNYAWIKLEETEAQVALIREAAKTAGKDVEILADLPGRRVQEAQGHTFDPSKPVLTEHDSAVIQQALAHGIEHIALSFVSSGQEVRSCIDAIRTKGQPKSIIAKIERQEAVNDMDEIIEAAGGILLARGDLGESVPLETLPFIQMRIVEACREAGRPVIVATQMMLSMMQNPTPTRAEVTDVTIALMQGATGVMLSEETASGKYPVEAVRMMRRIATETARQLAGELEAV